MSESAEFSSKSIYQIDKLRHGGGKLQRELRKQGGKMAQVEAVRRINGRLPGEKQYTFVLNSAEQKEYEKLRGEDSHRRFIMRLVRIRPENLVSSEEARGLRERITQLEGDRDRYGKERDENHRMAENYHEQMIAQQERADAAEAAVDTARAQMINANALADQHYAEMIAQKERADAAESLLAEAGANDGGVRAFCERLLAMAVVRWIAEQGWMIEWPPEVGNMIEKTALGKEVGK